MKTLLTALIAFMVLTGTVGCFKSEAEYRDEIAQQKEEAYQARVDYAKGMIKAKLVYVKDPHTGVCYSYFWDGDYHGGPAFTYVPCDLIPPEYLSK